MFEDYTYERLLEDVLNNAPEGIDTRPGSIFYDAISGILIKVAKLYTDIDLVAEMTSIATATGEALDARASEYGAERTAATKAKYRVTFEGTTPRIGERFYTNGQYFVLGFDSYAGIYYLEAEVAGSGENNIYSGTPAIPVNRIEGLKSATFGTIYENGNDVEDDEHLRTRVRERISDSAANGNKQHYKTWCESVDGVYRARIFPLWNGPNTVKAVLIDGEGKPCSEAKVAEVQNYIDPAALGLTARVNGRDYVVGDGLGEGVANLGAHFTAVAATALTVNVSFKAEMAMGMTKEQVQEEATEAVENYLKRIVIDAAEGENIVARISEVGAILSGLQTIIDYSELKLNGDTKNITAGDDDIPILGSVSVS